MRVHHLNCASFRPRVLFPPMVSHVLLVERDEGLLLVDTGFGTGDLADPDRLGKPFLVAMRPTLDPRETAVAQVKALGFSPDDVTDIAITHLDLDHAGGLADFPAARVHVHRHEHEAATDHRHGKRGGYLPAQWASDLDWVLHDEPGDDWFGFPAVTALGDDVRIIPLPGHTRGHTGVAVREASGRWLLHAGDAFFDGRQLDASPKVHPALALFQRMVVTDNARRAANLERLRELALDRSDEVTVFCAHDKAQYDALAARG